MAVYQAMFDWIAICPRGLNYVSTGAMGLGSSHGLGLALAIPERRVFVFDGDGSLLMNMGSLATIGEAGPANFFHFVFSNGTYEVNGSHPVPGRGSVDFAQVALACGYTDAKRYTSLTDFKSKLGCFLSQAGPVLADLKVVPGAAYPRDYRFIHSAAARDGFRSALTTR